MTVDQAAIWQPSPNYWSGRSGYKPRYIILHGTAGSGSGALSWLTDPASQVSAHYLILQSGEIYQMVDEDDSAWANGVLTAGHDAFWNENINPNLLSISIEHEKPDSENQTPLTAAQIASSCQLISRICQRWNIPTRAADANGGITGHNSIDPVNRANCPGIYPYATLFNYIQSTNGDATNMLQLGSGIGSYYTETGTNKWHCAKTNVDLIDANLAFYRQYEGIFGLPLSNEIYLSQYPGTAIVPFERAIQCYDPNHKIDSPPNANSVYLLHIDDGIGQKMIAKSLTAALNDQIAQAQAKITELQNQVAQLEKNQPTTDVTNLENEIATLKIQIANYQKALNLVLSTSQDALK